MNRNNPFGQFNSMTPQTQYKMNNNINNFNESFRVNSPMIEHSDFTNRQEVLHDNMDKKLLSESINDYKLYIDGTDRDPTVFANHYKFTVSFDPSSRQTIGETTYEGHPTPHINRKFNNIKYIKIESILLPNTNVIVENPQLSGTYELSSATSDKLTYTNRFLQLRIKELKQNKIYSTNNRINDQSIMLFKDHEMGENFQLWVPRSNTFTYTNANLKNINRLTFELLDDQGQLITVIGGDGAITDTTDIRHLQNKFSQITILIILGVVENELNIDTKYSS
jgi:hypothetical protein